MAIVIINKDMQTKEIPRLLSKTDLLNNSVEMVYIPDIDKILLSPLGPLSEVARVAGARVCFWAWSIMSSETCCMARVRCVKLLFLFSPDAGTRALGDSVQAASSRSGSHPSLHYSSPSQLTKLSKISFSFDANRNLEHFSCGVYFEYCSDVRQEHSAGSLCSGSRQCLLE